MIFNDTELNLYKVTKLEDDAEIYIVAENFIQLAEDLQFTKIEPTKVEFINELFLSNGIITKIGKQRK